MKTNLDILHEAFDSFKEHFEGSFHTTLWRVLVDGVPEGKIVCFVSNYNENGHQLGLAAPNEPGFWPCPAYFVTKNYNYSQTILANLNKAVFNMDEKEATRILTSSMRGTVNHRQLTETA